MRFEFKIRAHCADGRCRTTYALASSEAEARLFFDTVYEGAKILSVVQGRHVTSEETAFTAD